MKVHFFLNELYAAEMYMFANDYEIYYILQKPTKNDSSV